MTSVRGDGAKCFAKYVLLTFSSPSRTSRRGCVSRPEKDASSPSATATCSRRPEGSPRIRRPARATSARASAAVPGSIAPAAAARWIPCNATFWAGSCGVAAGAPPASTEMRAANAASATRPRAMVFNDVPILKRLVGNRSIPAPEPIRPERYRRGVRLLLLARHGQSLFNVDKIVNGDRHATGASAPGSEEARAPRQLAAVRIDLCVVSDSLARRRPRGSRSAAGTTSLVSSTGSRTTSAR